MVRVMVKVRVMVRVMVKVMVKVRVMVKVMVKVRVMVSVNRLKTKVEPYLGDLSNKQVAAVVGTFFITSIGAIALLFVFKKWNERTSKLVCDNCD